jgi:hypothetical protein
LLTFANKVKGCWPGVSESGPGPPTGRDRLRSLRGPAYSAYVADRGRATNAGSVAGASLNDQDAVFVAHTNSDIKVLRDELTGLDQARTPEDVKGWPALAGLPELPIIDTGTLPRLVALVGASPRLHQPGAAVRADQGTEREATPRARRRPRDRRRARGAAGTDRQEGGVLLTERAPQRTRPGRHGVTQETRMHQVEPPVRPRTAACAPRQTRGPPGLPPHRRGMLAWTDLAAERVKLCCQGLHDEVRVAEPDNGPSLLKPLVKLPPSASLAVQAGTLLGAIYQLIAPQGPGAEPAFASTQALRWWTIVRPEAAASKLCGDSNEEACPSCRAGQPCPGDVMYQAVADMAVLGIGKELTRKTHRRCPDRQGQGPLHQRLAT